MYKLQIVFVKLWTPQLCFLEKLNNSLSRGINPNFWSPIQFQRSQNDLKLCQSRIRKHIFNKCHAGTFSCGEIHDTSNQHQNADHPIKVKKFTNPSKNWLIGSSYILVDWHWYITRPEENLQLSENNQCMLVISWIIISAYQGIPCQLLYVPQKNSWWLRHLELVIFPIIESQYWVGFITSDDPNPLKHNN